MDKFAIINEDGSTDIVDMLQVQIDDHKILIFVGAELKLEEVEIFKDFGGNIIKNAKMAGKLSTINPIVQGAMLRVLEGHHWDFDKFPDPEVIKVDF